MTTGADTTSGTTGMFDRLRQVFSGVMAEFSDTPAMRRLLSGDITIAHYRQILRQVYHYTRDNPQIQVLAAVYFRGTDRDTVRMFFRHASTEIGHDRMALNDLASLGEDVSAIPFENPLPETAAFNAFVFHVIQHGNPVGYLGYLYFLEFLPTSTGAAYMDILERAGVPRSAMSFLAEHTSVDVQHNRLMEQYADRLIHTDDDFDAVAYAMRATSRLYASMLLAAIEQTDRPYDWGIAHQEQGRDRAHLESGARRA